MQRFSQIYLERPKDLEDSSRMRKRISSYYEQKIHFKTFASYSKNHDTTRYDKLVKILIEEELGISVPYFSSSGIFYKTDALMQTCELRDFLDIIFVINTAILKNNNLSLSKEWISFVERVFREEGASYTIDANGAIHFYPDEEFKINKQSTLSALSDPRYEQALKIYENAYSALSVGKKDTRTAVKDIFEAVETIAKLIDSRIKRLRATEVDKILKPLLERSITDPDERSFVRTMFSSLEEWVNAHHIYRHGQKKEKHTPPSLETAILSLSCGSAYLRALIDLDKKIDSKNHAGDA